MTRYRGRELARNAAIGELALATGLRLQEFSYLLAYEVPPLPPKPAGRADPVPGPGRGDQGPQVPHHLDHLRGPGGGPPLPGAGPGRDRGRLAVAAAPRLGRAAAGHRPGCRGGRVNGVRRPWDTLTPGERRRLVAPGGGSCLIAVRADGGPFTAWATVFERTADRIRARPSRGSRTSTRTGSATRFAIRTLERLVSGHYRQAARLVADTGPDAALAFYLSKADPLMVLRDLLGPLVGADHGKVPAQTGHHAHLPGGLRARRGWQTGWSPTPTPSGKPTRSSPGPGRRAGADARRRAR